MKLRFNLNYIVLVLFSSFFMLMLLPFSVLVERNSRMIYTYANQYLKESNLVIWFILAGMILTILLIILDQFKINIIIPGILIDIIAIAIFFIILTKADFEHSLFHYAIGKYLMCFVPFLILGFTTYSMINYGFNKNSLDDNQKEELYEEEIEELKQENNMLKNKIHELKNK